MNGIDPSCGKRSLAAEQLQTAAACAKVAAKLLGGERLQGADLDECASVVRLCERIDVMREKLRRPLVDDVTLNWATKHKEQ